MHYLNQLTLKKPLLGLLTCLLIWGGTTSAQADYLEGIGGTEVQLMNHLDRAHGPSFVLKPYPHIWVIDQKGVQATYNFQDGKVINVHFNQFFNSSKEANVALANSKEFLKRRGVFLEPIESHREKGIESMRGVGSGLNAQLFMVIEPDGRYRLNVGLSCRGN